LLLAQSKGASSLGAVGELLPHRADVATALAYLQNYLHLHDRAGMATRTIEGNTATLGYTLFAGPIIGVDQIYDGTLVIAQNIMRLLCGPNWKARAALLSRRRPLATPPKGRATVSTGLSVPGRVRRREFVAGLSRQRS